MRTQSLVSGAALLYSQPFYLSSLNMPEHRGQQHHRERMADAIRDEIGAIVQGELGDPRIGLVSVTEVQLSADGKNAHVFFSASGTGEDAVRSLEGLLAAKGYIRHEIGVRLGLRHAPELHFSLDPGAQYGPRIAELLNRIKKRAK